MDNEIRDNLIIILKLFKDKPQYLIKFLLENNAFTEDFLTSVFNSTELNRLRTFNEKEENESNSDMFLKLPQFRNISDMNKYFKNIIKEDEDFDEENIYENLNKELEKTLIDQLRTALKQENYEAAASLRDRMKDLNIKFDDLI